MVTHWYLFRDFRPPEVRYSHRIEFFIHVEFLENFLGTQTKRYVQIEVHGMNMERQGNTLYLDDNSDIVEQEMDEQMQERHNRTWDGDPIDDLNFVGLSC